MTQELKFKTNINCAGCVARVTPALNAQTGIETWAVDTTNADKLLTVASKGITPEEVITTIQKIGFQIEKV